MHIAPAPGGNNLIYRAGAKTVKKSFFLKIGKKASSQLPVDVMRFIVLLQMVDFLIAGHICTLGENPSLF